LAKDRREKLVGYFVPISHHYLSNVSKLKKHLHKPAKVFRWFFVIVTGVALFSYFIVRTAWKYVLTEAEMIEIVTGIQRSNELPNDFKDVLIKVYPNILSSGSSTYLLMDILGQRVNAPCPCRESLRMHFVNFTDRTRWLAGFYQISAIWELESRLSQHQCLNFYSEHISFKDGSKGLWEGAVSIYGRKLSELAEEEQLELILTMKNPSLYEKQRRPDLFEKEMKSSE
jgi:hypothetical protein